MWITISQIHTVQFQNLCVDNNYRRTTVEVKKKYKKFGTLKKNTREGGFLGIVIHTPTRYKKTPTIKVEVEFLNCGF